MDLKIKNKKLNLIVLLPFILVFILLTIEEVYNKIAYSINIIIITFITIISVTLFIIATLSYLRTKKNKFFQIMIAFLFFLFNSSLLIVGLIFPIDPIKVEIVSNLFFLGTLIWLLLPILQKNASK